MNGTLIQHVGKMATTSELKWSEQIIDLVEKLNPEFSNGQEILVYNETTKHYQTIDQQLYEDCLRMRGNTQ